MGLVWVYSFQLLLFIISFFTDNFSKHFYFLLGFCLLGFRPPGILSFQGFLFLLGFCLTGFSSDWDYISLGLYLTGIISHWDFVIPFSGILSYWDIVLLGLCHRLILKFVFLVLIFENIFGAS